MRLSVHARSLVRLLGALVLCVAVLPALPVSADEPVWEFLTESRTLSEDHVGGIHVKDDNVTLDCDGYSIFWTPGDEDAGVLVEGVTGVTVRDCVIDGFDNGVLIAGSRDVLVTNTVSYSIVNGFFVGGYHPDFPDYESHHVTLKDNEATGISDGEGIGFYVEGGHDITLKGNVATGLFDNGFRMWGPSRDNLLVGNRAEANGSHGFEIQGFYDDGTGTAIPLMHNVLKGNISIGNGILHGGGGFQVGEFSTMNVLKDNWASANMGPGFGLVEGANLNELIGNTARDNVHGFSVFDSADNALRDNTAVDNEEYGFEVAYGADGNFLGGNTSTGNGFDGILVLESNGIVLHDNRVIGNGQSGIAVWASEDGAITDNTSRKNQWNGFAAYVTDGPLSEFSGNKACHNGEHDGADFSPAFGGDTATWIDNKFCESLYIWAP